VTTEREQSQISIVLPTYNGTRYLREAIESCLAQTYARVELIIVDDGSTDARTGEILAGAREVGGREVEGRETGGREADGSDAKAHEGGACGARPSEARAGGQRGAGPRIRVVSLERNMGLPGALNAGFREARGEWLTWTSDDNLYRPNALEVMARELGRGDADFVYARAAVIDEAGAIVGAIVPRPPKSLILDNCIGPCFLYTREVLRRTGEFDPAMSLVEDYEYWIRVSKRFRMRPIDENLYLYRRHSAALSSVEGRRRVTEMADKARRQHFRPCEILAADGLRAFDRGDLREARGLLLAALARWPWRWDLYRPVAICVLPGFAVRVIVRAKAVFRGRSLS